MGVNPGLFAVIEEGVGEYGGDRRKCESVCHGEGDRKEERTVSLVRLEVQRQVIVDDSGNVICFAGIIEGTR
jgi:hypothetical protein